MHNSKIPLLEPNIGSPSSRHNNSSSFKSPLHKNKSSPLKPSTLKDPQKDKKLGSNSSSALKGKKDQSKSKSPQKEDKEKAEEDYIKEATTFLKDFVVIYKNSSVEQRLDALSSIFKMNKLGDVELHLSAEVKEMIILLIKEQMPKLSKARRETVRHTVFAIDGDNKTILSKDLFSNEFSKDLLKDSKDNNENKKHSPSKINLINHNESEKLTSSNNLVTQERPHKTDHDKNVNTNTNVRTNHSSKNVARYNINIKFYN